MIFLCDDVFLNDADMSWMKKNIVWVMLGGVIILFLLNFSMIFFIPNDNTRGTFGDQFGAVNALFSGLAFTGLIYTIILQRRDLEIQRHDLKLQREEIAMNRKEMEEQSWTLTDEAGECLQRAELFLTACRCLWNRRRQVLHIVFRR